MLLSMSLEDRFRAKFVAGDPADCWEWLAGRNQFGYGTFRAKPDQLAHRFAWRLERGPIPDGMSVCHRCDNPGCVNPGHLFLGTHADNMADKANKGRAVSNSMPRDTHPMTRFSEDVCQQMTKRYEAGETQQSLAAEFDTYQSVIGKIVRARTSVDGRFRRRRGSDTFNSKLTDGQVRHIRQLYLSGESQAKLAEQFGIAQSNISKIVRRVTYPHLDDH